MNIYKIIFNVNNENLEIKKSFYYRYETKYFGKILLFQKRYKRFYGQYETNLKDGREPDYMSFKTVYRLLADKKNNYKCFNHKNELIKKDNNFYKYINLKNSKLIKKEA